MPLITVESYFNARLDCEETPRPVLAANAREAAERYAEQWCRRQLEYPSELIVIVRPTGSMESVCHATFVVDIETVPIFTARPMVEQDR